MIEIVVKYDKDRGLYLVYEPTTETLFMTASLGESFLKLSQFLQDNGMIADDILKVDNISYHIDSATFIAMVESNANLLKRLSQAPSGFTISSQRFGVSAAQSQLPLSSSGEKKFNKNKSKAGSGTFSKSAFRNSNKKFGGNQ